MMKFRETWQSLYLSSIVPLTNKELDAIRSLNDEISLQDVIDVYLPLIYLVRLYKKNIENLSFSKGLFLQKIVKTPPLIIGISGSVAVGKSTAARLVQLLLSREFKKIKCGARDNRWLSLSYSRLRRAQHVRTQRIPGKL